MPRSRGEVCLRPTLKWSELPMISAREVELRAGARLLLESASFQVSAGDRIGLVRRNGAGKTTLAKLLAGQVHPPPGPVRRSGAVGYLPPPPPTGDPASPPLTHLLPPPAP